MSKLILENRKYIILDAHQQMLEKKLKKIGERVGFRVMKVGPDEKLEEIISKIKMPLALISDRPGLNLEASIFLPLKDRYLKIDASTPVANVLSWLHQKVVAAIPRPLAQLIENAIMDIAPRLLGSGLGMLVRSDDFERSFSNLITCDSDAENFSAKASCEVDFIKIRSAYPSLKEMSDTHLIDLFSEICNQALGSLNFRLREIGLDPRISLPMGVILRPTDTVTQVDYMPMVRLIDPMHTTTISIAAKIGPQCQVKWDKLVVTAADGDIDFL